MQITAVHNIGKKSGYNGRSWTKHGKLPYVTYEQGAASVVPSTKVDAVTSLPVLKKGTKGDTVKALQILLIGTAPGYSCGKCGADGAFGSATESAVKAFQEANGLEVDGKVGPQTWAKLLGV